MSLRNDYFLLLVSPLSCSFSTSFCESAISYEVAITLCQKNERAGTSWAGSSLHVLMVGNRRMKAEKVAPAGEDDCCGAPRN